MAWLHPFLFRRVVVEGSHYRKVDAIFIWPQASWRWPLKPLVIFPEQGRAVRSFKLRDIRIPTPAFVSEDSDAEFALEFSPHLTGTRDTLSTFIESVISISCNEQYLRQNCSGLLLIEYQYVEGSDTAFEYALENLDYRDRYRDILRLCHFSENSDRFLPRISKYRSELRSYLSRAL